ncbi:MAG: NuoI/complex I 23 kDa subunit family protein [Planctomycetota bacterium]|jgi:NADH-quinone oxidoreductase subunit I
MAKVVPRPELTWTERLYFVEIFKGMRLTIGHALKSFTQPKTLPILDYPEVQPDLPQDYRARHRLMQRPDGDPRCVACYMCSTACPANCIDIVAESADDRHIEKRPAKFDIDLLLCIYCGLCVEACPCDAIRMDTKKAVLVADARNKFIITKDELLDWNPADYPESDIASQEAPGGLLNEQARAAFISGTEH